MDSKIYEKTCQEIAPYLFQVFQNMQSFVSSLFKRQQGFSKLTETPEVDEMETKVLSVEADS